MAYELQPQNINSASVAAASLAERLFAKLGATSGSCALCGAGEKILGITLGNTNSAGEDISFARGGRVFLSVDGNAGAISIGDRLISNASGQGVKSTTDTAEYGAVADGASTGATDVIPVYVEFGTIAG